MARIIAIAFILVTIPLFGWDATPKCFRQIERTFFRASTIKQALALQPQISQSVWEPISRALVEENRKIPLAFKNAAKKLKPDPTQNPFNAEETERVFKRVVRSHFTQVMQNSRIGDQSSWNDVFEYIYRIESQRIQSCFY